MSIAIGIQGRAEATVTEENTAIAALSGTLPVFATPHMIALMEHAAVNALAPYLSAEESSVGTYLDVCHDSATPLGMKVWADCEVTEVDGRFLTFSVAAYDEAGPIGKGTHKRCIVATERFMNNTQKKKGG